MIDWGRLTLILYILMRMSGFVLFNPILGRRNFPGIFQAGLILVLTWTVAAFTPGHPRSRRRWWSFPSDCCWSWAWDT